MPAFCRRTGLRFRKAGQRDCDTADDTYPTGDQDADLVVADQIWIRRVGAESLHES